MIKIGVIGFGYWGPNLVRNFFATEHCTVKAVADLNQKNLYKAQHLYPSLQTTTSADDLIQDPEIDAIVIAVPVSLHYPLAKKAFEHDKHVLIEKPMTDSVAKAEELVAIAAKQNKVLMVDHTFLYTGAVQKIKQIVSSGEVGDIQYFDSVRINLGLFQHDINVSWDLAPHDISILLHLVPERPTSVLATGISHTDNRIENISYLTLYYDSNKISHFANSWTSPVKIRRILIGGSKKMILFDDMEPTEKIKLYDTSYRIIGKEEANQILVDYRVGDIFVPKVAMVEALRGVAADFIAAIREGTTPVADCQTGVDVVRILEAADRSIKNRGQEVLL